MAAYGFSLAESLRPLLKYLPAEFANDLARDRLLTLAAALPSIHRVLLECRFNNPNVVDLSIGVLHEPQESRRVLHALTLLSNGSEAWGRVLTFLTRWIDMPATDPQSYVWLEFDLDQGGLPAPSVFVSTKSGIPFDLLASLSDTAEHLARIWQPKIPADALDFVGVMVPRNDRSLRLNLSGLTARTAWDWLQEHADITDPAWGDFETTFSAGQTVLAVEATESRLRPRLGLECRPTDAAAEIALFNLCLGHGFCTEKSQKLARSWHGTLSAISNPGDFPASMVLETVFSAQEAASHLLRHINHLKVTFDRTGAKSAKLYLGYSQITASATGGQTDT